MEDKSLFQMLREKNLVPDTRVAPPASSITAQNVLSDTSLKPEELQDFSKMPITSLLAGIEGKHLQTFANRMGKPFDRVALKAFYLGRDLRYHLGEDLADKFVEEISRFGRSGSMAGLNELTRELAKALAMPGNSALVLLQTVAKRYISRAPQFGSQVGKRMAKN